MGQRRINYYNISPSNQLSLRMELNQLMDECNTADQKSSSLSFDEKIFQRL